jgi:hypothetical protein
MVDVRSVGMALGASSRRSVLCVGHWRRRLRFALRIPLRSCVAGHVVTSMAAVHFVAHVMRMVMLVA